MPNPHETLREKLSRFNRWETERLKHASPETRLARFLVLHDLGRSLERHVIERRQEEHLQALVSIEKRLKRAASRPHRSSTSPRPERFSQGGVYTPPGTAHPE